jgi:hypothetical protein
MIYWKDINYLHSGTKPQQSAYKVLMKSKVLETLKNYSATVVGTYPLDLAVAGSDLDIICEVKDHDAFSELLKSEFLTFKKFELRQNEIREVLATICRFEFEHFPFEIFGQNKPIEEQWAYRHMLIEYDLLKKHGEHFKQSVITLKQQGIKTEAAFAMLLKLPGDPYEALLQLEKPHP